MVHGSGEWRLVVLVEEGYNFCFFILVTLYKLHECNIITFYLTE